jgi:colicin import membrane protein
MRQELSEAYEAQALEYEQFKSQNEAALSVSKDALKKAVNDLELMRGELAQAVTRAERAEAKISEIEHRVSDLRSELERAHQDADTARTALAEQKQVHQAIADDLNQTKKELVKAHSAAQVHAETYREQRESMQAIIAEFDQVKSELIKTREQRETAIQNASRQNALFDKALSERDFAISESNKAREEAAELRGQIDAIKEQNEKLLDAIRK